MELKRKLVFSSEGRRKKNFSNLTPKHLKQIKFQTDQYLKSRSASLQPLEINPRNHKQCKIPSSYNTCVLPTSVPVRKSKIVQLIDNEMDHLMPKHRNSLPVSTIFYKTQLFKEVKGETLELQRQREDVHALRHKIQQLQRIKKMTLMKQKKRGEIGIGVSGKKAPEFETDVWKLWKKK